MCSDRLAAVTVTGTVSFAEVCCPLVRSVQIIIESSRVSSFSHEVKSTKTFSTLRMAFWSRLQIEYRKFQIILFYSGRNLEFRFATLILVLIFSSPSTLSRRSVGKCRIAIRLRDTVGARQTNRNLNSSEDFVITSGSYFAMVPKSGIC